MELKTILVPTDFSEDGDAAISAAREWARPFGAKIHLLHAYYLDIPPSYIAGDATGFINPQPILDPMRESAESFIKDLIQSITEDGTKATSAVVMGHPSQVILEEASRLDVDLIIMGTRGLTGLKHVVLGSTAERVVRMAQCPVLTVKSNPDSA